MKLFPTAAARQTEARIRNNFLKKNWLTWPVHSIRNVSETGDRSPVAMSKWCGKINIFYRQIKGESVLEPFFNMEIDMRWTLCVLALLFPCLYLAAELIYAWRWLYIPWQRQHFYGCPFAHLFGYGLLDSEIPRDICIYSGHGEGGPDLNELCLWKKKYLFDYLERRQTLKVPPCNLLCCKCTGKNSELCKMLQKIELEFWMLKKNPVLTRKYLLKRKNKVPIIPHYNFPQCLPSRVSVSLVASLSWPFCGQSAHKHESREVLPKNVFLTARPSALSRWLDVYLLSHNRFPCFPLFMFGFSSRLFISLFPRFLGLLTWWIVGLLVWWLRLP